MRKIILFLIFALPILYPCLAQKSELHTGSKKAVKSFNKAQDMLKSMQVEKAMQHVDDALKFDTLFIEAWLMKAEIYDFMSEFARMTACYKKVYNIDPLYDVYVSYKLAAATYASGRYAEATEYIDNFIANVDVDDLEYKDKVLFLRANIYFSDSAVRHPVDFRPMGLGDGVNTQYDEYWPSLSADEQTLVFTRQIPSGGGYARRSGSMHEDLFVSYYDVAAGSFGRAIPLPGGINSPLNEGAQCLSADGKTCIITCCNRSDGVGRCDLYIMFWEHGRWTKPQNMRSVNSPAWESNPSLSADGRYLYFASGRAGGIGKTDIWCVEIDEYGNALGPAKNLGKNINTTDDEMSPFIHPDGKTLYFASKGHVGLGKLDLYYSKLGDDGRWGKPVNLGYPINTHGEERSLIVNAKGDIAMFASSAGRGNLDIYYFDLPPEIKPTPVTYVKGYVYDKETGNRLQATCELIDLETETQVAEVETATDDGDFLICLPVDKNYAFNVDKKGYLFFSENFSLKNIENPEKPYEMNIPLQPLKKGVVVVLKNIFFEFNRYDLLPASFAELNKVVTYMNDNPNLKIEIGGHTDNVGTKAFNKVLSENRAKAVYDYLLSKGVAKERLVYKGFDFSVPIATNDTDEGRALNRRTEFKVIGN